MMNHFWLNSGLCFRNRMKLQKNFRFRDAVNTGTAFQATGYLVRSMRIVKVQLTGQRDGCTQQDARTWEVLVRRGDSGHVMCFLWGTDCNASDNVWLYRLTRSKGKSPETQSQWEGPHRVFTRCTGSSGTLYRGWWYTWTGSYLIR
jgi:hypothetical protein